MLQTVELKPNKILNCFWFVLFLIINIGICYFGYKGRIPWFIAILIFFGLVLFNIISYCMLRASFFSESWLLRLHAEGISVQVSSRLRGEPLHVLKIPWDAIQDIVITKRTFWKKYTFSNRTRSEVSFQRWFLVSFDASRISEFKDTKVYKESYPSFKERRVIRSESQVEVLLNGYFPGFKAIENYLQSCGINYRIDKISQKFNGSPFSKDDPSPSEIKN